MITQQPPNQTISVLISGGVDSAVLLAKTAETAGHVYPLYIRSGLFWEEAELKHVQLFLEALNRNNLEPLTVLDLPITDLYGAHWSVSGKAVPDLHSADEAVYLPGRNLLLLSKAFLFCALHHIPFLALGLLKGNPFPDSAPEFFDPFQEAASAALSWQVQVITPFLGTTKSQVIQEGRGLPLELTFSCIHPIDGQHCGSCNKCAERQKAFVESGVYDKTIYHSLPPL